MGHLHLFLVFHVTNKASLNPIVCAGFFRVIIWSYFLQRAYQKSISHFFFLLLEKHRPGVIKCLIRQNEQPLGTRVPSWLSCQRLAVRIATSSSTPLRLSFPWVLGDQSLQAYQCLYPPFHTASQETPNHPPISLLFTSAAQENDLVYAHCEIRIV